jgi:DNA mismatch repair ATPase MutL
VDPASLADIQRTVGTTVAVVKIFDALPVRRADFIKRIKSQRAKLLRVLQSCKRFYSSILTISRV